MVWIGLSVCLLYAGALEYLRIQWMDIPTSFLSNELRPVSIIIPARNEQDCLAKTLQSVFDNNYPAELVEVIVVDDHSLDATAEVASSFGECVRLLRLGDHLHGKKAAITLAVEKASSDIIICTDADSLVGQEWIRSHVTGYLNGSKLSFGAVQYAEGTYSSVLNLELSALVLFGAVYNSTNRPGMINGCNYSFDRKAFMSVGGFVGNEKVPTGDDEFLLRKILSEYPEGARFIKSEEIMVTTAPPKRISDFLHQRRRWASKWRIHDDLESKVAPIILFSGYTIILVALFTAVTDRYLCSFFLLGIIIKSVSEYRFCSGITKIGGRQVRWREVLMLQFIYPVYVIIVGMTSNFGKYSWRGREYHI